MRITTEDVARQVLLDTQRRDGCIPTIPASGDTIQRDDGWAFFNVKGYLGTVTVDGDVIVEYEFEANA
jgi:hypothetical protein